MKTATQVHFSTLTLNAALQSPASLRVNNPIVLPSYEEVERRLRKVNALIAWYHEVQSLCCLMLTIAGIGTILYSAGMFLHPTGEASFSTTDAPCVLPTPPASA